MSQRFYPRNSQGRRDAIAAHRLHGPRQDRSRRDGLAAGKGNSQCTVAGTGTAGAAAGALESEIVTGGKTVILTITGSDKFRALADIVASVIAGLPTAGGIKAALVAGDFTMSANRKAITCVLPAVAAYAIAANASYDWTLPFSAFENRALAVTVTAAIEVANEA